MTKWQHAKPLKTAFYHIAVISEVSTGSFRLYLNQRLLNRFATQANRNRRITKISSSCESARADAGFLGWPSVLAAFCWRTDYGFSSIQPVMACL